MSVCGIICEYNPFHTGHAYQIAEIKKLGHSVVCVMSGDFVQRGECAFSDKEKRALNAINHGADVVLELPFPFSSMSAEGFARASIEILSKSGLCTHFAFGSESADIELLSETAAIVSGPDFVKGTKKLLSENPSIGFARARSRYICENYGEKYMSVLENPNDILAVEYLKANMSLEKPLIPIAVKRTVPRSQNDTHFASSSFIRSEIKSGNLIAVLPYLPYEADISDFLTDDSAFTEFLRLCLSMKTPEELKNIAEVSGGVNHAIVKNAKEAENYSELAQRLANKATTDAKVRRMLLFCLFGIDKKASARDVRFTKVLAMTDGGRKLLSETRKQRNIIIAGKASNVKTDKIALEQYNTSENARRILYSCRQVFSPQKKED